MVAQPPGSDTHTGLERSVGADPASSHDNADWFEQSGFRLRFGWGPNGLRRLAPAADALVIVDILSFSTAVDVALGRGAVVLPYRWHDGSESAFAEANGAEVASKQPEPGRPSLRPSSLQTVEPGVRLVLPSPNGSALAFAAAEAGANRVLVGSLRNASAVGRAVAESGPVGGPDPIVTVIAAGERWRGTTGPLRPAIEDLLGAGAILSAAATAMKGVSEVAGGSSPHVAAGAGDRVSPEARVAMAAFAEAEPHLAQRLSDCGSGRELIDRGYRSDVELAAALDCSSVVPTLRGPELVDG